MADGRLPQFYPPSPASRSGLQHCSTTEIQLASTSMTGVGDQTGDELANDSTVFPALAKPSNSMTLLLQESYDGDIHSTWSSHTEACSTIMGAIETTQSHQTASPSPPRAARVAGRRAADLARRLRARGSQDRSIDISHNQIHNNSRLSLGAESQTESPANFTSTAQRASDIARSQYESTQIPEPRSFIIPMEPLPSGTPIMKQQFAARGIMRDPKTPGSGQSVRFFSRDVYQSHDSQTIGSILRPDGRSVRSSTAPTTQPHAPAGASMSRSSSLPNASQLYQNSANILDSLNPNNQEYEGGRGGDSEISLSTATNRKSIPHSPLSDPASSHPSQQQSSNEGMQMFDVFGSTKPFAPCTAQLPQTSPPSHTSTSAVHISLSSSPAHNEEHMPPFQSREYSRLGDKTIHPPGGYVLAARIDDTISTPPLVKAAPLHLSSTSPQALSPSREVIVLDDTSDCSKWNAVSSPSVSRTHEETVYLTPETSKRGHSGSAANDTVLSANHSHSESSISRTTQEKAAENVFSTHKQSIEVISKERDGWKELCNQLMADVEARFAVKVCENCRPVTQEGLGSAMQNGLSSDRQAQRFTENTSSFSSQSAATVIVKSRAPLPQQVDVDISQLQDNLRDLQIHLETKQKDCDEERRKAEIWESKYQLQRSLTEELQSGNQRHIRDARDIDVKMELHARERENKVRQQLQAQIQSMKLELEAAHQENEVLACTIADQRMSPSSSKVSQQQSVVEAETSQHSPQTDIDLQSKVQSVLADLALEKEHTCQMETTANIREKTIYELQTQLTHAQETNAQDVENVQRLESVCEELAKETLRTAELTSVLQAQEEIIASLQKELDDERGQRTRDKTTQNERIGELEVAYSDQVAKNHEQYMELEEAMDEREAKFSDRIRELETESDQQQRDIAHLRETARKLKSAESQVAILQQGLARTQAILEERVRQVSQITEKIELQERQLRQQDDAMAALKRQAADDVFRSTKQERRIEKLLHDREMLNIAVEQLQIHIQLVKRQYKARTGTPWEEGTDSPSTAKARPSIAGGRADRSVMTPLGVSRSINYSVERSMNLSKR